MTGSFRVVSQIVRLKTLVKCLRNDGNDIFEAHLQRGGNVCVQDRPKHLQPFGEITYLVFPTKIYLFGFSPKLFVMFGHQALLACVVD